MTGDDPMMTAPVFLDRRLHGRRRGDAYPHERNLTQEQLLNAWLARHLLPPEERRYTCAWCLEGKPRSAFPGNTTRQCKACQKARRATAIQAGRGIRGQA